MRKLTELANIVALKENTPYIRKFSNMVNILGNNITIIDGSGGVHEPRPSLMGAKGFVAAIANFIPKTMLEIYKAERIL